MILVCFAVPEEARAFRKVAPEGVAILVTGMGRVAAERGIRAALGKGSYECVLTCGFAGGLDPALASGTLLYSADPRSPVLEVRIGRVPMVQAKFACSDRVITTAREKAELRKSTGADAVEMESEHIRAICHAAKVPSATIRVLLDPAWADLPLDFNALSGSDHKVSPMKLASAIARKPSLVPKLIRLGRESGEAARVLAEALARITS